MRLCKLALLARRTGLHRPILESFKCQRGDMPSMWLRDALQVIQAVSTSECAAYSAAAVQPALADGPDSSSEGSSRDMSLNVSSKPPVSHVLSSSQPAQHTGKEHQPVKLSDVVRSLKFDWDDRGSEESDTSSKQQRADSGLSASTSKTLGSGTRNKSAKNWRSPSAGRSSMQRTFDHLAKELLPVKIIDRNLIGLLLSRRNNSCKQIIKRLPDEARACPGVDDRWYSLSPHFVDSKLPEWKQWRLRNRAAPEDQPLSEAFKERLEALKR